MTITTSQRSVIDGLHVRFERDVSLAPLTWYGVGGLAPWLVRPASVQQLSTLAAKCRESDMPVYVLGRGANLLVADQGVNGVVVQLDDPFFKRLKVEDNIVTVGAGFDLAKLVLSTAKAGLGGIECLAGIPASVGGAVRMNAGGAYGEIGRVVRRVMVCDATGQVYYRNRDDLVFGYRKTNIVARYILEVELELVPTDPHQLVRQVKDIFSLKKARQPLGAHSAGCAFKNPQPRPDQFSEPLSAGRLIEEAGLKGYQVGGAEVSSHHANFIVTKPGCSADDVLALMGHVQQTVSRRFGVWLEREVVVWS